MVRKLLVLVGVVLTVVLPTALIPKPEPRVFDVAEVIRTFKQHGVALRREPFDPRRALETLETPRSDVVVVVYRRTKAGETGPWELPPSATRARRANVFAAWTRRSAPVRLALSGMNYSSTAIAVPEVVAIFLHVGQSQILKRATTPNGAEVQCVHGTALTQHFISYAHFRPGASGGPNVRLVWRPRMPGWQYLVSCRS